MFPGNIKNVFLGWDVLVVDDEPDSLEVATRWLKISGATVYTAINGRAGLARAREVKPRFILADLTMPEMDGWELLYEIKQDLDLQNTPVIALTAHAMHSTKERAAQAGFVAHISKPLDPLNFVSQVVSIVEGVPELATHL